jgi:hypothetical protein
MARRDIIGIIVDIREKSTRHLPIDNSLIPFDLIFKVGLAHASDENLSVKSLFADLPHSAMGMRYHLNRLLDNGWIEMLPSPSDRRSKIVRPTEKLLDRLYILSAEMKYLLPKNLESS